MNRFFYKRLSNGVVVGVDGQEFDRTANNDNVRVWDSLDTDHVWSETRLTLIEAETVKIIWFDKVGNVAHVSG